VAEFILDMSETRLHPRKSEKRAGVVESQNKGGTGYVIQLGQDKGSWIFPRRERKM